MQSQWLVFIATQISLIIFYLYHLPMPAREGRQVSRQSEIMRSTFVHTHEYTEMHTSFTILITVEADNANDAVEYRRKRVVFDRWRASFADDDGCDEHLFNVARMEFGVDDRYYFSLFAAHRVVNASVIPGRLLDTRSTLTLRSLGSRARHRQQHVAIVADARTLSMYVDGHLDATLPLPTSLGVTGTHVLLVGTSFAPTATATTRRDDVTFLADSLDANDISELVSSSVSLEDKLLSLPSALPVLQVANASCAQYQLLNSKVLRLPTTLTAFDYLRHLEFANWKHWYAHSVRRSSCAMTSVCSYFWTFVGAEQLLDLRDMSGEAARTLSGSTVCLPMRVRDRVVTRFGTLGELSSNRLELCATVQSLALNRNTTATSTSSYSMLASLDVRFASGAWKYDNDIVFTLPPLKHAVPRNASHERVRRMNIAAPAVTKCVTVAVEEVRLSSVRLQPLRSRSQFQ
jgi:hypothetical protein